MRSMVLSSVQRSFGHQDKLKKFGITVASSTSSMDIRIPPFSLPNVEDQECPEMNMISQMNYSIQHHLKVQNDRPRKCSRFEFLKHWEKSVPYNRTTSLTNENNSRYPDTRTPRSCRLAKRIICCTPSTDLGTQV